MMAKHNQFGLPTLDEVICTTSIYLVPPSSNKDVIRTPNELILIQTQIPMIVRKEMVDEPNQCGKRLGRINHF